MKIKTRSVGLILSGIGITLLSILTFDYETTKADKLSQKIDSLLLLISDCGYPYEKSMEIVEILYIAQTKLTTENNYDNALSLTNLAIGKLFSCQSGTQIESPYLILFPILILMIIFGLILSVKKI